jgi:hypothetical protein
MRYETLTLGGNVIRFPVELRAKPSIDLLVDVAPDSREVELIAEAFGFDAPDPEGRAKADRAMAERIAAMDLPVDRQERRAALNAILKPLVDRAVTACAQARQASLRSDADNEKFAKAQIEGGYWLAPLKEVADYWVVEAARLQIVAHDAAQTAHGAGRAIEFAKRGEAWRPSNIEDDMNALIAAEKALAQIGPAGRILDDPFGRGRVVHQRHHLSSPEVFARGPWRGRSLTRRLRRPRAGVRRYPHSIGLRPRYA